MIGEKHRDAVFGRRRAFLTGESTVDIWQSEFADDYSTAAQKFGEDKVNAPQKRVILQVINEYWSDYLDYTSYLRDGIHLTRIGGKNPADEYNITCEEFFSGMEEQVIDTMGERLQTLLSLDNIDDFTGEDISYIDKKGDEVSTKIDSVKKRTDIEYSGSDDFNVDYDENSIKSFDISSGFKSFINMLSDGVSFFKKYMGEFMKDIPQFVFYFVIFIPILSIVVAVIKIINR